MVCIFQWALCEQPFSEQPVTPYLLIHRIQFCGDLEGYKPADSVATGLSKKYSEFGPVFGNQFGMWLLEQPEWVYEAWVPEQGSLFYDIISLRFNAAIDWPGVFKGCFTCLTFF